MANRPGTQRLQRLLAGPVLALDGDIGAVRAFYFDDDTWTVRYVVVETGKWLRGRIGGRSALLSPTSVQRVSWLERIVEVSISRERVANSPAPEHVT